MSLAPQNCVFEYVDSSPCSASCGPGTKTQTLKIITPPVNMGAACPKRLQRIVFCNEGPCQAPAPSLPPLACTYRWDDATACTPSCAPTGTKLQKKVILTPAVNGGAECPMKTERTVSCSNPPSSSTCTSGFPEGIFDNVTDPYRSVRISRTPMKTGMVWLYQDKGLPPTDSISFYVDDPLADGWSPSGALCASTIGDWYELWVQGVKTGASLYRFSPPDMNMIVMNLGGGLNVAYPMVTDALGNAVPPNPLASLPSLQDEPLRSPPSASPVPPIAEGEYKHSSGSSIIVLRVTKTRKYSTPFANLLYHGGTKLPAYQDAYVDVGYMQLNGTIVYMAPLAVLVADATTGKYTWWEFGRQQYGKYVTFNAATGDMIVESTGRAAATWKYLPGSFNRVNPPAPAPSVPPPVGPPRIQVPQPPIIFGRFIDNKRPGYILDIKQSVTKLATYAGYDTGTKTRVAFVERVDDYGNGTEYSSPDGALAESEDGVTFPLIENKTLYGYVKFTPPYAMYMRRSNDDYFMFAPGSPLDCQLAWKTSGSCSSECGGGTQDYVQYVTVPAVNGGSCVFAPAQKVPCNTQKCCNTGWVQSGPCDKLCGGTGTQPESWKATTRTYPGITCPPVPSIAPRSLSCGIQACSTVPSDPTGYLQALSMVYAASPNPIGNPTMTITDAMLSAWPGFSLSTNKKLMHAYTEPVTATMISYTSPNFVLFAMPSGPAPTIQQARYGLYMMEWLVGYLHLKCRFDFGYRIRRAKDAAIRVYKIPTYFNYPYSYSAQSSIRMGSMGFVQTAEGTELPFSEIKPADAPIMCHEFFHMVQGFQDGMPGGIKDFHEGVAQYIQEFCANTLNKPAWPTPWNVNLATNGYGYDRWMLMKLFVETFGPEQFGQLHTNDELKKIHIMEAMSMLIWSVRSATELIHFWCREAMKRSTKRDISTTMEWFSFVVIDCDATKTYAGRAHYPVYTRASAKTQDGSLILLGIDPTTGEFKIPPGTVTLGISCAPHSVESVPDDIPAVFVSPV